MLTHPTLDQLNHLGLYGMAKAFGAIVVQIEGSSYRLRRHADLLPEPVRANTAETKRRGRPPKSGGANHNHN